MGDDILKKPFVSYDLHIGSFKTAISTPVVPAPGYSGIFHFPFRIYAREELEGHCGSTADGSRFRVHPPFLVRKVGSPLTDDVPHDLWPDFRWHPAVPAAMRGDPDPPPEFYYSLPGDQKVIWYDGLRFDFWGSDSVNKLSPFVLSAMRWLRWDSLQPWISDVDRYHGSTMKRSFPIDDNGAAVHEVSALDKLRGPPRFCCVTTAMWKSAFDRAAEGELSVFYNLFFDGVNAAAADDYQRAVMNLAMAIEGARDYFFSKIHPVRVRSGREARLKPPFNDTDLLRHLTSDARKLFGRDMSTERPDDWLNIQNLYQARGEVAHGKSAVYRTTTGPQAVTKENFFQLQASTWEAVRWIEDVTRNAKSAG